MDLGDRKFDTSKGTPLYGFTGNEVKLVGVIDLPVLFGSPPCQISRIVKFHVVNTISSFNAIIGRTTIGPVKAITSIAHLKMKFPTEFGVGEVCRDQRASRQCYLGNSIPKNRHSQISEIHQVVEVDPREIIEVPKPSNCEPNEELEEVDLYDVSVDKKVQLGAMLPPDIKEQLIQTLRNFADIFAWDPKDMPGIPEEIALHRLNISPEARPVKQKTMVFSSEKQEAIDVEINKLLKAGFIKEVQFPQWIANAVMMG
ncbi:uncharacterized protein LOC141686220 [Apium graveolens]|uniref:uncharacterized protein LOC141686220 n=1 Tax=Apium graveolens TaxID=4045 RepID=UPI003D7A99A1